MVQENSHHPPGTCRDCGCELDYWDRHLQFRLPDAVLSLDPTQLRERMSGGGDFLEVRGYGTFVRCLLRVTLTQDNTVTFGVWLAVPPAELRRASEMWDQQEYAELELFGALANAVPPWGDRLLGAAARAVVRDTDELPYVVEGFTVPLDQVLTRIWPHTEIHPALPH